MNLFLQKHHRSLFYSAWLLLALAQSASTQLISDEAYYWMYSKFPAWGYFDHPPMIALLVKGGYTLFQNEFGLRLFCVLLSTFTIIITESLIDKKNPFLFYTIVLSLGVLQFAGFLAVPDTPLLFFTAVFFYCYRIFLQNISWRTALLLAFSVVLLFYTKYHGLLIIFFTLLSNLKLLNRWQTWLAGFFVLILFAPHLYWQWEHNWVSFRYHLFESNVNDYKLSYTTDYLLGQLLLAGPLSGLILLPAAFLYKTKNETEKSLKLTMIGIYIIFLISSFRGKVEPNWTMPALIPLIVLSHQLISEKISWQKPLRIISFISLLLILAGRIYLVVDIGPENAIKRKFHHHKEWAKSISEKTGTLPVVFYNDYQWASLFWFYSGKPSHSFSTYGERRSNYNFWPTEDQLLGQRIYFAGTYNSFLFTDSIQTAKGLMGLKFDSSFSALGKIKIVPGKIEITNRKLEITFTREMSGQYSSFLVSGKNLKNELLVGIFKGKKLIKEFYTGIEAQQLLDLKSYTLLLDLTEINAGNYFFRFGFAAKNYPPTHNSEKVDFSVK